VETSGGDKRDFMYVPKTTTVILGQILTSLLDPYPDFQSFTSTLRLLPVVVELAVYFKAVGKAEQIL
jgi:hypothetical protein